MSTEQTNENSSVTTPIEQTAVFGAHTTSAAASVGINALKTKSDNIRLCCARILAEPRAFHVFQDEHTRRFYVRFKDCGRDIRCQLRYRLILECRLGRKLARHEVVHHIDGDCTNDAPENLEVLSHYEHSREHATLERGTAARLCPDCGRVLPLSQFYTQHARSYSKFIIYCKPCHRVRVSENRSKTWFCHTCEQEYTKGSKANHLKSKGHYFLSLSRVR